MAEETRGKILFFPNAKAEEVFRRREENLEGVKLVLGDLGALVEVNRALAVGEWPNARIYIAAEIESRVIVLRELLRAL